MPAACRPRLHDLRHGFAVNTILDTYRDSDDAGVRLAILSTYLGHIKESGHGSVLEHAVWNLLITGVSRTLTHELIRHRAGR